MNRLTNRSWLIVSLVLATAGLARADEVPPPEDDKPLQSPPPSVEPSSSDLSVAKSFSTAEKTKYLGLRLIDRPMTLPSLMLRPTVEFSPMLGSSNGNFGFGASLGVGIDVGITRRLQAGIYFSMPLAPFVDFGQFMFNGQYNVLKNVLSVRLDLGAQRFTIASDAGGFGSFRFQADGFVVGIGAPVKLKLHPMVAIISGSSLARGIEHTPIFSVSSGGVSTGATAVGISGDVFTFGIYNGNGLSVVNMGLHVPVGVLVQPHPMFAFAARTGYRLTFTHVSSAFSSSDVTAHYIPVAVDAIVTPHKMVDVGVTVALLGSIASSAGGTTADATKNYASIADFSVWAAGKF